MGGVVRFLDVEVDRARFEVRRDGSRVPTEPQVFEVLAYLIDHRDRVVPREELLDNVWGDRFVSDSALASRIKSARRAVGDDGTRQKVIATVHGRGYRFVPAIEIARTPADGSPAVRTSGRMERRPLTVAPPFLAGRDEALDELGAAWDDARAGEGRLAVVRGEAGIGKSALVQTFLDGIDAAAAAATCLALRAPTPLTPVTDVIAQLGQGEPAHDARQSPALAVTRIVELIGHHPTVIAIDDLHWADDSTLDAVVLLARSLPIVPLLLIVTARDREIPDHHPLWGVVADLRGLGALFIDLESLGPEELELLAADTGLTVTELEARTGGNPLFVRELLASPHDPLPAGVRDVVLARLAQLPTDARRATELVAMSPVPLELSVAATLLGGSVGSLAPAERVGLLTSTGETVGFRHELVRDAVHDSVTALARVPLHRQLLGALPSDADDARTLHHAAEGLATDVLARVGPGAARRAALADSHREACTIYEKVLRHCRDLDPVELARLTSEYAYQRYLMWELEDAEQAAEVAARMWQELGDAREEGSVLTTLARVRAWTSASPAEALEVATRAVDLLRPGGPTRELGRALCELAGLHTIAESFDSVTVAAEAGQAVAMEIADRGLQALALNYLGCAASKTGSGDWELLLRRSLDLAAGATPREYAVRASSNLAVALWDAGRWSEAADVVDEGLRQVAGVEYQAGVLAIRLQSAHVALAADRLDDAEAALEWITARDRAASYELEVETLRLRARMRRDDASATAALRLLWTKRGRPDPHHDLEGSWRRPLSSYPVVLLMTTIAELAWREDERELAETVAAAFRMQPEWSLWRTDLSELCMYLSLCGIGIEVQDLLEPFDVAVRGDLHSAAEAFDRAGRRHDARLCRDAVERVS